MRELVERCKRFWRDSVRGPHLKSYETAREELGGVPWRTLQQTERWFLAPVQAPPPVPPDALDSAAFRIARPSLAGILRAQAAWIVGGAALLALVIGIATLSSSAPALAAQTTPALAAQTAPALAAQTAPVLAAQTAPVLAAQTSPASAQARTAPSASTPIARRAAQVRPKAQPAADGLSPSVRALFSSKPTSSSRKHSRVRRHGRR
ncbi:MAG TPA: hypothetical protein VII38_22915 [Polyangia bacterium]